MSEDSSSEDIQYTYGNRWWDSFCSQYDQYTQEFRPDIPFDSKYRAHVDEIMQNRTTIEGLNTVHVGGCSCGCSTRDLFIDSIVYGSVRIDILRYILTKLDLGNPQIQNWIVKALYGVLSSSGTGNWKRIHLIIMFLLDFCTAHMLDVMRTYRDVRFGTTLLHSACYGHDCDNRETYINMLLDIGVDPNITAWTPPPGSDDHSETTWEWLQAAEKYIGRRTGQCIVEAGWFLNGNVMHRLITTTNLEVLNGYSEISRSLSRQPRNHYWVPLIPMILHYSSHLKNPEWLQDLANVVGMLLEAGVDYIAPTYLLGTARHFTRDNCSPARDGPIMSGDVQGAAVQNITDCLRFYGWWYDGSPMLKVFTDFLQKKHRTIFAQHDPHFAHIMGQSHHILQTLPAPLDPEFKHFHCKFEPYDDGEPGEKYEEILDRYADAKDPRLHEKMREELDALQDANVPLPRNPQTRVWRHVPCIAEFFNITE